MKLILDIEKNKNIISTGSSSLYSCLEAFCSMFALIYLLNISFTQISIIIYLVLFILFYLLYKREYKEKACRESKAIASLFTLFMALGDDWLGKWLGEKTWFSAAGAGLAFAGFYFVFKTLMNILYKKWSSADDKIRKVENDRKQIGFRYCFFISFAILWIIYFIFFLNQYPGSLSCDTPGQLSEAVGERGFENANPLINTLLITACVKAGMLIFDNINAGVAFYTIVQFTMAAAVFAYVVSVVYKKGYHKILVYIALGFYGIVPYNIVYATGMWKDTFFALLFLLTITYFWDKIENISKWDARNYICLLVLAVVCSLSRNSGWSALLAFAVFLSIYSWKNNRKMLKSAVVIVIGIILNFGIITFVYPIFASASSTNITTALSVPIQQISRVVAIGCTITEDEKQLLDLIVETDKIPEIYDETISDPVKFSINKKELQDNFSQYIELWLKLGCRYPKCYLDAYLALTKNYWYPDASSWTWDTRIFENKQGVYRTPVLASDKDIASWFNTLYEFPKGSVFKNSSTILWLLFICMGYAGVRKNKLSIVMYVPILMIYAGLMLTSPVALFRYTYGAAVCLPLLVCFPYIIDSEERK